MSYWSMAFYYWLLANSQIALNIVNFLALNDAQIERNYHIVQVVSKYGIARMI